MLNESVHTMESVASCERSGHRPSQPTAPWRDQVVEMIPSLRGFARSLSRNPADADDLVQDTLIKAWSNRDKFEAGTNLRAWLFTILRNTWYTACTRRRREVADEDGKLAARLSVAASQEWSAAWSGLQNALAELPNDHREALMLVAAAGLTYDEAAEICGCPIGTIKSRVNRARARLVRALDVDLDFDDGVDRRSAWLMDYAPAA